LLVKDPKDNGFTNEEGVFSSMIEETGEESSRALFFDAKRAYNKKLNEKDVIKEEVNEDDIKIEF